MAKVSKYPNATKTVDRHGKTRWRFRKGAFSAQLHGAFGSDEFKASYDLAVAGLNAPIAITRQVPFSIGLLVAKYYETAEFQQLADSTKRSYRDCLEPIRTEHGHKRVRAGQFEARNAQNLLAQWSDRPSKGNNVRKRLLAIFRLAVLLGWRTDNPIEATRAFRVSGDGYHTWTDAEIDAYLTYWLMGSVQHLAVRLMLAVGASRADACALGWRNVANGRLSYRRQKTKDAGGVLINLPLTDDLLAVLPAGQDTFLQTQSGAQRTPEGLGNLIKAAATAAGMPHLSSHGLRKACARRLAEAGATASQIASVTGHKGLNEVSLYTRAADRADLADQAAEKMTNLSKRFVNDANQAPVK